MLYHILRLACISFSTFKTWTAVTESPDRSKAKKHLFLWLLILLGLALEPIADSLFSDWLPYYETLKILLTGWLLIAQYYLDKPGEQEPRTPAASFQDLRQQQSFTGSTSSSARRSLHSPTMRFSSYRSSKLPLTDTLTGSVAGSDSVPTLDFARFRRQLDESRHRASSLSSMEPSSSSFYHSREQQHKDADGLRRRAQSGRQNMTDSRAPPLERKGPLAAQSRRKVGDLDSRRETLAERVTRPVATSRSQAQRAAAIDDPLFSSAFKPDIEPYTPSRQTSAMPNPFQIEGGSGPTSTLIGSTTLFPANSPNHRKRTYTSLSQQSLPAAPQGRGRREARPRSEFGRRQELHQYGGKAFTPARDMEDDDEKEFVHRRKQTRRNEEAPTRLEGSRPPTMSRMPGDRETDRPFLPSQIREKTLRPVTQAFPRPKPPGKNRVGLVSAPASSYISSSSQSRNHNVLGAMDISSSSHKRKALRQLNHTEPKRVAISPSHDDDDGETRDDDGHDDHDSHGPLLLTPKDIQRTYDALIGVDHRETGKFSSQAAGSSSQESEATLVDWSRFLSSRPVPHQRRRNGGGSLRRDSSWTSTTPTLTKQLSMETTHSHNFHHSPAIKTTTLSPLIKLRQSQLKQQQKEDVLGSKRFDDETEAQQEIDGKGHFLFDRALDEWEREDLEIAAAAAAEEAARAAEVRVFKGHGTETAPGTTKDTAAIAVAPPPLSAGSIKEAPFSSVTSKHYKVPPAPSDSLLRTISFNGDSSKRPVPEFGPAGSARGAVKVDVDYRQEQPLRRSASRATPQPPSRQQQQRVRTSITQRTATKPGHSGLYTPSRSTKYYLMDGVPTPEKTLSTPTMSRYIQLSAKDDDEDDYNYP